MNEEFEVGDKLIGSLDTYHDDYRFYIVTGKTKGGNLRVNQVKCEFEYISNTPSDNVKRLIPDFDDNVSSGHIARYSAKKGQFQVKKDNDFHYMLDKYNPDKEYRSTSYG